MPASCQNLTKNDLTHPFLQGEWHFPKNPKIDGDTARVLKSDKIINHRGA